MLQVVAFLAENVLIAGGFDGEMYLFQSQNYDWQLSQTIQGKLSLLALTAHITYCQAEHWQSYDAAAFDSAQTCLAVQHAI